MQFCCVLHLRGPPMRVTSIFTRIAIILFALELPVAAQVTGAITGTVRDTADAVIPGAKVTVSNSEHGIHRNTVTDGDGDYLVQGLSEGTYTVTVAAPGFSRYVA